MKYNKIDYRTTDPFKVMQWVVDELILWEE